jgi:sugar lactone lactonase YvrE
MRAEQITDRCTYHGEGAVWSSTWGGLRFVDMLNGDVVALAADGSLTCTHIGEVAACVRPRTRGGWVAAIERGFLLVDEDGTQHPLPEVWQDRGVRMNEGGCDPDGRFYCGSMAYAVTPGGGSLYRLSPDGTVDVVLTGVTISNGFDFSPDGTIAYYVDTPTGEISAFDYDSSAGLTNRRTFALLPPDVGGPDGLTVDSEGGVWVALWGGGAVRRYAVDGTLDAVVEVAASQVTSCALGGPNLDELYITTSWENKPADAEPAAGAIFRAHAGVRGKEPLPYAG